MPTTTTVQEQVAAFAAAVFDQRKQRIEAEYRATCARHYPDRGIDGPGDHRPWEWEVVNVHAGPKYTRVDVGPEHNVSGKYMIDNATGEIFGIKGYGRVHKGHRYGTLDTIDAWDWSGYTGQRRAS